MAGRGGREDELETVESVERVESVRSVRWEIRGRWPSVQEIERRFEELIRSRWGARGRTTAEIFGRGDELLVEVAMPGLEGWSVADAATGEGVLRIRLRREPK